MSDNTETKESKAQGLLADVTGRVKESGPEVYNRLRDVKKAAAVSPDLIAALNAFGEKAMIAQVSEAMAPLSLLGRRRRRRRAEEAPRGHHPHEAARARHQRRVHPDAPRSVLQPRLIAGNSDPAAWQAAGCHLTVT
jgi:hypothetical protein